MARPTPTKSLVAIYDKEAERYLHWTPSPNFQKIFSETVVKSLAECSVEGASCSVLELGCGDGIWLKKLAMYGDSQGLKLSLTGIDFSAKRIEVGQRSLRDWRNIQLEVADIFQFVPTQDYQLIFVVEVLQYLSPEEQDRLLEKYLSYLSSSGRLVIIDKERYSWFAFKQWLRVKLGHPPESVVRERFPHFARLIKVCQQLGYPHCQIKKIVQFRGLTIRKD